MSEAQANTIRLPFRPRARLLQLLGDQLIGTPRLAVFELVKNAYDADARSVLVTLNGIDAEEPVFTIKDDGDGMTLGTIRDIWLVPADDHRERQRRAKQRTRLNRLPLGEKGIGRFAVHKLGNRIELVTRASGEPECVTEIDWQILITKPYLSDAEVTVRTRSPQVFRGNATGTRLVISELRDKKWSRGEVRRLLRQITSISSPFADRHNEFTASLEVPEHPEWILGLPSVTEMLDRAPWRYRFNFDGQKFRWEYEFRGVPNIKLQKRRVIESSRPLLIAAEVDRDTYGLDQGFKSGESRRVTADAKMLEGIGPIQGTFFVFDRDREVLANLGDSALVQNFLNENGGVRLYRDGIRVYTYGEPNDDWLGLDLRRVNTPTRNISRNIVVGAVDLSLDNSDGLTEKTNREGFVENGAYRRLRQIVLGAIAVLEIERKEDKDRIRSLTGKGKDPEANRIRRPLEELRVVTRKHKVADELDPYITKIETDYNDMRETMLRAGLSGLGMAVVFHEVERGVRVLYETIEKTRDITKVRTQAKELVRMLDGFSELLRKGDRRHRSLRLLLTRARDLNRVRFRTHSVRCVCPTLTNGNSDAEPSFTFGLVLGALNNILDNSFYWLRVRWPDIQEKPSPRAIYLDINHDLGPGPALIIADTGPGLQDEPERLIRPFFSRRPDGMGLGLYYANLVMELNGGRLLFPDAADLQVPKEFSGAAIALVFNKDQPR